MATTSRDATVSWMRLLCLTLSALLASGQGIANTTATYILSTVVGGSSLDGRPAVQSAFRYVSGIAVAPSGEVYITDSGDNKVRKVLHNQYITTVAGIGVPESTGDGGPAKSASFNAPACITFGAQGEYYVGEQGGLRVRRISSDGIVSAYVGGSSNPSLTTNGAFALDVTAQPSALAIWNTRLLVVDSNMLVVFQVLPNGTISYVLGGGFSTDTSGPALSFGLGLSQGITVAPDGSVYVSDTDAVQILQVFPDLGTMTSAYGPADGSTAWYMTTIQYFNNSLYFLSLDQNCVAELLPDRSAHIIYTAYGITGFSFRPNGHLLALFYYCVLDVSPDGVVTPFAGNCHALQTGDGLPATNAWLSSPEDVVLDPSGRMYIADRARYVRVVEPNGTISTIYNDDVARLCLDGVGGIYMAQETYIKRLFFNGTLRVVAGTGNYGTIGMNGPATSAALNIVKGMALAPNGVLYFADMSNQRVRAINVDGTVATVAGTGSQGFSGDGGPATLATLNNPVDVGLDTFGNIYISDSQNGRVRRVNASGIISTYAGGGPWRTMGDTLATNVNMNFAAAVAPDRCGNMFFLDGGSWGVVRLVTAAGWATWLAGDSNGFSGDGGPGRLGNFKTPTSLSLDVCGQVYVADSTNARVRTLAGDVSPRALIVEDTDGMYTVSGNLSVTGTCITAMSVGPFACTSLQIQPDIAICTAWASVGQGSTTSLMHGSTLPVYTTVAGVSCTSKFSVTLVLLPTSLAGVQPTNLSPGSSLWVRLNNFPAVPSLPMPSITVGGYPCVNVSVAIAMSVLQCIAPTVPTSVPGYPLLRVTVTNLVGATTTELVYVEYPTAVAAQLVSVPEIQTWPSAAAHILPVSASLTVSASGKGTLTCTLFISTCTTTARPLGYAADGVTVAALVGDTSLSASVPASDTSVPIVFTAFSLLASSGTTCNMSAVCRDTQGGAATASISTPSSPAISTPTFALAWDTSRTPLSITTEPGLLPSLYVNWSFAPTSAVALPTISTSTLLSSISCMAVVVLNGTVVPSTTSLSQLQSSALSSASAFLLRPSTSLVQANFTGLSVSNAVLGAQYSIFAECTWVHTGERMRLPELPIALPTVSIAINPSTIAMFAYEDYAAWSATLLRASVPASQQPFASASGTCSIAFINASSPGTQFTSATLAMNLPVLANGTVVVQPVGAASSGSQTMYWRLDCRVWGKPVQSPVQRITILPYLVAMAFPFSNDTLSSSQVAALTSYTSLSSDALGSSVFPALTSLRAVAQGVTQITCSLTANASKSKCMDAPSLPNGSYGVPMSSLTVSSMRLVGETAASTLVPSGQMTSTVTFPAVGLYGPSACYTAVYVSCTDAASRSASSASMDYNMLAMSASMNATLTQVHVLQPSLVYSQFSYIATPRMRMRWNESALGAAPEALILPPVALPVLSALFYTEDLAGAPLLFDPAAADLLSCIAMILPATTSIAWTAALGTASKSAISTCSGTPDATIAGSTVSSLPWNIDCLSMEAASWAQSYRLHAECTYTPTGERLRLPPVDIQVPPFSLQWNTSALVSGQNGFIVPSYFDVLLGVSLASQPLTSIPGGRLLVTPADITCSITLVNSTLRTASVQSTIWRSRVDLPMGTGPPLSSPFTGSFQAPPATRFTLRADCEVFNHVVSSDVILITTAEFALSCVAPSPSWFIPSDSTSPLPVTPALVFHITMPEIQASPLGRQYNVSFTSFQCSLTSASDGMNVFPAAPSSGLSSSSTLTATADAAGIVTFPAFIIQSAFGRTSASLSVSCSRATGDGPPAFTLTLQAVSLSVVVCTPPQSTVPLLSAMPPFSLGISTTLPSASGPDTPCNAVSTLQLPTLPQVGCSITFDPAHSTMNDTSSVFLQQAVAVMDASTHMVEFDSFIITAPQDNTYAFLIDCFVGSIAVPSPLTFQVTMSGCPIGMEPVDFSCSRCKSGLFSFGGKGGRCTGCPPAGATCENGLLQLLPNFFRPPSQASRAFGVDTELHPCYNTEACTLNTSSMGYDCASGYEGPLCSVCDAANGFARFGEACRMCWVSSASWAFVIIAALLVLALLTRVALKKQGGERSEASIALRIAMSFVQATGSMRVFSAGTTKAYRDIVGWTDAISASPLSVGAFQCIWKLPYLAQFIATVSLPAAAAIAVVLIFLAVTFFQSISCKPSPSFNASGFRQTIVTWMESNRHWATLLFVLFLAYMPITSSSLRALDCYSPPIDGVTYLRLDMAIQCYVGQHAVAQAIAYSVLVLVGVGFPALLAWLLGTATHEQLGQAKFRNTWGFLYDGYKEPTIRQHGAAPAMLKPEKPMFSAKKSTFGTIAGFGGQPQVLRAPRLSRASMLLPSRLTQHWVAQGDSLVWWESLVLFRKAGVVLLAVLVTNPYLQCVGASLWFLGFLQLQLFYRPYAKPLFNRLESLSLASSLLTAMVSTALLQYNATTQLTLQHEPADMTPVEWAVTVILVILNLGTFIILVLAWLWLQFQKAQGIVRRVSARVSQRGSAFPASQSLTTQPFEAKASKGFVVNPLLKPHTGSSASGGDQVGSSKRTVKMVLLPDTNADVQPLPSRTQVPPLVATDEVKSPPVAVEQSSSPRGDVPGAFVGAAKSRHSSAPMTVSSVRRLPH